MRATLIVFPPPCFDELFRLLPIEEPVGVQALASQGSVEAFNEGIVGGLVTTEVPTRQERLNHAKVARIQIDAGENASRIPGVPGSFCISEDETNWNERSYLWHEGRSTQRSRL